MRKGGETMAKKTNKRACSTFRTITSNFGHVSHISDSSQNIKTNILTVLEKNFGLLSSIFGTSLRWFVCYIQRDIHYIIC